MITFKSSFYSQIPEFQSAAQLIPDMDMDVPHIPISALQPLNTIPIINGLSIDDATSSSEFPLPLPTGQGPVQGNGPAGQELVVPYANTFSTPTTHEGFSNAIETPAPPRPAATQLTHPIPEPSIEVPHESPVEFMEIPIIPNFGFMGLDILRPIPPSQLPQFLRDNLNGIRSSSSGHSSTDDNNGYNQLGSSITAAMIQDIQRMITIARFPGDDEDNDDDEEDDDEEDDEEDDEDDDEEDDDDDSADDEVATDEEAMSTVDDGPSTIKKRRRQDESDENRGKNDKGVTDDDGDASLAEDDDDNGQSDVLPDLPQPKPEIKSGPADFSAQEHIFLAWAKTMSTFTAKRQAIIKMQINKIMSEAEFEDLDDEFFAG